MGIQCLIRISLAVICITANWEYEIIFLTTSPERVATELLTYPLELR